MTLFGLHPVTFWICASVAAALALTPLLFLALDKAGKLNDSLRHDLWTRYKSWLVLAPLMILPLVAGRLPAIAAVALLGAACYREFARATGLFRERLVSGVVAIGIVLITYAVATHWHGFSRRSLRSSSPASSSSRSFPINRRATSSASRSACLRSCSSAFRSALQLLCQCRQRHRHPARHPALRRTQRHLRLLHRKAIWPAQTRPAHEPEQNPRGRARRARPHHRALRRARALHFFATRRSITPGTSPRSACCFRSRDNGATSCCPASSATLGIKDMAATIPGHGGLLDRFDSLLFVGPALFHYLVYFDGIRLDQPARALFGGG